MKILAYTALVSTTAAAQAKGASCTAWYNPNSWLLEFEGANAEDDASREDWMASNVFNPADDSCNHDDGENCVMYFDETGTFKQTCQTCDFFDGSTVEYFNYNAGLEDRPFLLEL